MAGRVRKSNKSFAKEPSSKISTRSRTTRQVEVLADVVNVKTRKKRPPKQPLPPSHPSPSPTPAGIRGSRRRYKTDAVVSALVNSSEIDTELSEEDITEEETAATNEETNINITEPAAIKNDLTSGYKKKLTNTACNNKPVPTRALRSKGPLVVNLFEEVESVNDGVESNNEEVESVNEGVESVNEGVESDKEEVELANEGVDSGNEGADEEMGSDHIEVEDIQIDEEEEPISMVTTSDKWACLRGMEVPVGREEQARAIVSIMGEVGVACYHRYYSV